MKIIIMVCVRLNTLVCRCHKYASCSFHLFSL